MTTLIGALLIGLTLGLLGSGGSAITVPILVYLVGHGAKASIAESMAIVGIISFAGAIPKATTDLVNWNSVLWFGTPAMLGAYLGAWLGGLSSDSVQLTVFGVVIILAAVFMLKNAFGASNDTDENQAERKKTAKLTRLWQSHYRRNTRWRLDWFCRRRRWFSDRAIIAHVGKATHSNRDRNQSCHYRNEVGDRFYQVPIHTYRFGHRN